MLTTQRHLVSRQRMRIALTCIQFSSENYWVHIISTDINFLTSVTLLRELHVFSKCVVWYFTYIISNDVHLLHIKGTVNLSLCFFFIKGRQTSIVRDDNFLRELTPTENRASREAQRWQPHHSTTQLQTGTLCWGINITHKLHEMKSEQAVLPNPCLEEEEELFLFTKGGSTLVSILYSHHQSSFSFTWGLISCMFYFTYISFRFIKFRLTNDFQQTLLFRKTRN
jgi:hypothetical protein